MRTAVILNTHRRARMVLYKSEQEVLRQRHVPTLRGPAKPLRFQNDDDDDNNNNNKKHAC